MPMKPQKRKPAKKVRPEIKVPSRVVQVLLVMILLLLLACFIINRSVLVIEDSHIVRISLLRPPMR